MCEGRTAFLCRQLTVYLEVRREKRSTKALRTVLASRHTFVLLLISRFFRLAGGNVDPAFALRFRGSLWTFLLTFHLREAFLQRGHQIYDGRGLLGLLDCAHFFAFEMGLDQFFHVG